MPPATHPKTARTSGRIWRSMYRECWYTAPTRRRQRTAVDTSARQSRPPGGEVLLIKALAFLDWRNCADAFKAAGSARRLRGF